MTSENTHAKRSLPDRLLFGTAGLTIALILLALAFRVSAVNESQALAPGVAATSGCEEESHFAVWKRVHGEPVYADPSRAPFAVAYFNFLFYEAYAGVSRSAVERSGDFAIVRVGRVFTLVGGLCGAVLMGLFAWRLTSPRGKPLALVASAVGSFALLGPLSGWWLLTVRPDIWALTFETAGLVALLLLRRRAPVAAVCCSALGFYLAWAFKQSVVQGLLVAGLFLLVEREWKLGALLGAIMGLAWTGTLLWLGLTTGRPCCRERPATTRSTTAC